VGVNWPFGIYRLLSAPGRNTLKFKRSPFAAYLLYRSQRMILTVNLTVKVFSVFCFGILPSSQYAERGKPYK